jgi:sugar lactone lactonase YvrE
VTRATINIGYAIDWLPDGRLLVSGPEGLLVRSEPDGPLSVYADLRGLSGYGWNELVVDGRGNAYVNSVNFDFMAFLQGRAEFAPGIIALVTPNGSVRQVADGIAFPNGMAVTPDNSTLIIAESFTSKLTAFDIAAHNCFACMLGGQDGRTLFMMAARWRPENPTGGPRTGRVLTARAPAPGVGWP